MMCPWTNKLTPFHDDELTPVERQRVVEHLRGCDTCVAELRQMQRLSSLFADLKSASLSPGDIAMERWRIAARSAWRGDVLRLVRTVTGVAAAVLVGGLAWLYMQPGQSDLAPPATWEQTALLLLEDDDPPAANVNAPEADLAQWIVMDLSNVSADR